MYLSSNDRNLAAQSGSSTTNLSENFNAHLFQHEAKTDSSFMAQQNMPGGYYRQTTGASSSSQEVDLLNPSSQQPQPITVSYLFSGTSETKSINAYDPTKLNTFLKEGNQSSGKQILTAQFANTKIIGQYIFDRIKKIATQLEDGSVSVAYLGGGRNNTVFMRYGDLGKMSYTQLLELYKSSTKTLNTLKSIDERQFDLSQALAIAALNKNYNDTILQDAVTLTPIKKQQFKTAIAIAHKLQQDSAHAYEKELLEIDNSAAERYVFWQFRLERGETNIPEPRDT
jgi:hypothetical protein